MNITVNESTLSDNSTTYEVFIRQYDGSAISIACMSEAQANNVAKAMEESACYFDVVDVHPNYAAK